MHYLVTGHTGFKGAWLVAFLSKLGHEVSGIALPPEPKSVFQAAGLEPLMNRNLYIDIRNREEIQEAILNLAPDVVIHMAAQPLVLRGYEDPVETFDTNVSGTLNVIAACRKLTTLQALLVITTDKVYRDSGTGSYKESDPLGGFDPYSASKAMADLLTQSFANLDPGFRIGIARAGNVIGAGDISANRVVPDINRSLMRNDELVLRMPSAVRPWQHVLDCLNGYLAFVEYLLSDKESTGATVLNIGPDPESYRSVLELVTFAASLKPELRWKIEESTLRKETSFLTLDSSAARNQLGWRDKLDFETAVRWSLADEGPSLRELLDQQIVAFKSF